MDIGFGVMMSLVALESTESMELIWKPVLLEAGEVKATVSAANPLE